MAKERPAPGDLELVREFVNTRDIEERREQLSTPGELHEWLHREPDVPVALRRIDVLQQESRIRRRFGAVGIDRDEVPHDLAEFQISEFWTDIVQAVRFEHPGTDQLKAVLYPCAPLQALGSKPLCVR